MTHLAIQGIDIAFIQGSYSTEEEPDSFTFQVDTPSDEGFPVFGTLDVAADPGRVVVGCVTHLQVQDGSVSELTDAELLEAVSGVGLKGPAWELMSTVARQVAATMKFAPYDPEVYPDAEFVMRAGESFRPEDGSGSHPHE